MENSTERLTQTLDGSNEMVNLLNIFDALADSYTNVLLIDAEASKIKVLKVEGFVNTIFNKQRDTFYDFEDVKKQYIEKRVHPKDRDMMDKALSLETIKEKIVSGGRYMGNYLIQEDGKPHYYQFKFVKLSNIKYIIGGFQNTDQIVENQIVQRKQLQVINALSSEYKSLYLLNCEKNTWSVYKTDGSSLIQNALEQSDISKNYDETIRAYIMNFVVEEDREYCLEHANLERLIKETPKTGIHSINYDRIVGNGRMHWQANTAKFTADDGKVYIVLGFRDIHDIVEKQISQENALRDALMLANRASRAKTTFLNNMSHDIRTPMNAIIGFTALAQNCIEDSAQVSEYLQKIHTSSTHLLGLINEILDMSRIESGIVKLEENIVHIPSVLNELRTIMQGQVEEKQQAFTIEAKNMVNEYVITDRLRLNQILLNIVSNAIKYTDCGGSISVCVEEKSCEKPGYVSCEFRIRDNGMGMSKEFSKRVFDVFSRESTSTISGIQGTGLGMSITKNIVEMMNGTITVESELGKGSEFIVLVDFKTAENVPDALNKAPEGQNEKSSAAKKAALIERNYSGKKILLVEDNELNREIATVILENAGMTVDTAEDGTEAVNIMNHVPEDEYDLILMDIQMPKMDGYTATKEIRTLKNNRKANIPIVAMTANAFDEDRKKSFEAGMNGYIAKPIDIDVMAGMLDGIFSGQ